MFEIDYFISLPQMCVGGFRPGVRGQVRIMVCAGSTCLWVWTTFVALMLFICVFIQSILKDINISNKQKVSKKSCEGSVFTLALL